MSELQDFIANLNRKEKKEKPEEKEDKGPPPGMNEQ